MAPGTKPTSGDEMEPPTEQRAKPRTTSLVLVLVAVIVGLLTLAKLFIEFDPLYDYDSKCGGCTVKTESIRETSHGLEAELYLSGEGCQFYSPDVPRLRLLVEHETDTRLHVVIQDLEQKRYQVPEDILPRPSADPDTTPSDSDLAFQFSGEYGPFSFRVLRKSTGEVLFDTSGTGLVFERQFLRLKTWLPRNPNIYGLGEHTDTFRLPTRDYKRTFWARDAGGVPYRSNLYSSHPVYVDHRLSGTHGVFLVNSNGMDILLGEDNGRGQNYLEYRAIGGIFDFYFLSGPSPTDVSRQYGEIVGRPAMIPYWSLGVRIGAMIWLGMQCLADLDLVSSMQVRVSGLVRGSRSGSQLLCCRHPP